MNSYSIKSIKKKFKENGVFYTPEKLALIIKSFAKENPSEVYDPTCGDGGLLSVFDDNVKKYGQELDENQLNVARKRLINFTGFAGDTLKEPGFNQKFDCIVGNPPFSINWNPLSDDGFLNCPITPPKSKADYAFIIHILSRLKDDGVASILNFPGILYRGNKEGKIREWLIKQNFIDKVVLIPEKTFEDTAIATVLLVLRKNKESKSILFKKLDSELERLVEIEEIAKNDYNLSPSLYIVKNVVKEVIKPKELLEQIRKSSLLSLKKQLEFDKMVCIMEDYNSFEQFKKDMIKIIKSVNLDRNNEKNKIDTLNLLDLMKGFQKWININIFTKICH